MLTTRPRGTNDFLPGETEKWQYVENVLRTICKDFGYQEIRTPIFEHTELFQRGVGETTDIVEKEMYTFTDKKNRSLTLRPESTASTVRAYLEHKLYALPQPVKLYYIGPMFRYEKPQAGRFRQFHQFGVEVFGSSDPGLDAEVIGLAMGIYHRLGLRGLEVHMNSVGCPQCRPKHKEMLQEFLKKDFASLCPDCRGRYERNPLRILDCKNEKCQEITAYAPTILNCLCPECREHFDKVKHYMEISGIKYLIDERLVRGLDYYTKTAFEILVNEIGAQSAICGGGRYDGLIDSLGGPPIPGVGFALGMERIFPALESQGISLALESPLDVFVVTLGDEAGKKGFQILMDLRMEGIKAEKDYLGRGLKAQMKTADRMKAKYAVIIGENELDRGIGIIRNMETSAQQEMPLDQAVDWIKRQY
ncbi:histidine--tRNA ligase [Candidatus Formimonas warabiya]|uniref:Histidine--tRNA ligase n=1 Tax=Formimonas warabiya TaxID=1761012 RepID=A0A3G1KNC9_FORW1|nr:histidine--tRNA ligase [Candidatus Formimonas warabiya]ATW23967.1 histidine--tRNA ligase [Candidatus Formimonas warabiya]